MDAEIVLKTSASDVRTAVLILRKTFYHLNSTAIFKLLALSLNEFTPVSFAQNSAQNQNNDN